MELILATGNAHKAEEFSILFPKDLIAIKAAPKKLDVEEHGKSFMENAYIKAKAYFDEFQLPVLADDSGLTVMALQDELGIYSARFGGEGLSDRERATLLLKKMDGVPENQRGAYFTCVLCFYVSPTEHFFFEGRVEGRVAHKLTGEHGFGYDPLFIPLELGEEKSLAEVPEWKDKNSHRAKAVQFAVKFFGERNCQTQ